jgi:hypothetical protein
MTIEIITDNAIVIEVIDSKNVIEITESASKIVEIQTQQSDALEIIENSTDVIEIVQKGAQGGKGDAGGVVEVTFGENISAYRCVYLNDDNEAMILDVEDVENSTAFAGVTKRAQVTGEINDIQFLGYMTNSSWNFTANLPVFLGANGIVTQTIPTTGFTLRLGFAATSTSVLLNAAEITIL